MKRVKKVDLEREGERGSGERKKEGKKKKNKTRGEGAMVSVNS